MDDEAEVIRSQMMETRTSMTEKFEAIEDKLTSVVQETAGTVTEAVGAVSETVDSVKEAVQDTVKSVTGAAEDAVASVKEAFDLRRQVERNPWAMMGGAVAVGFAGGLLLSRLLPSVSSQVAGAAAAGMARQPTSYSSATAGGGNGASNATTSGWLGELGHAIEPVVNRVKSLAIGATVGMVGQMVLSSVPEAMRGQFGQVVDELTTSLGGERIKGLEELLPQEQHKAG